MEKMHLDYELKFANRLLRFDDRSIKRIQDSKHPSNPIEAVMILMIIESHELLRGVRSGVKEENLRVAVGTLRSLLETAANIYWILQDTSGKRAEKYVRNMSSLSKYLNELGIKGTIRGIRLPKNLGSWTTSSAEDRVNAFSPDAGIVWDYCSLFTHGSPTGHSLHGNLPKVLDFALGQANVYALTIRHIVCDNSRIYTQQEYGYLERIALELLKDKTNS